MVRSPREIREDAQLGRVVKELSRAIKISEAGMGRHRLAGYIHRKHADRLTQTREQRAQAVEAVLIAAVPKDVASYLHTCSGVTPDGEFSIDMGAVTLPLHPEAKLYIDKG